MPLVAPALLIPVVSSPGLNTQLPVKFVARAATPLCVLVTIARGTTWPMAHTTRVARRSGSSRRIPLTIKAIAVLRSVT